MAEPASITCDCLPGYRFVTSLGRSPLAEVWKVEAPDGRLRAARFLGGNLARRDLLTADDQGVLARLQDIHHPGLANVELVEHDHGRLVLVTDLAEQALRSRFEQCVAAGQEGISRGELLGYLRTAAEALDFLNGEHGLQHLCLSPAFNLLLADKRLLLADFGLVEMLWIPSGQSLAKLNPRYAAPELLEERRSKACDQYSLALIYQELLTGELPHRGKTIRQVLSARMDGRTNLEPLAGADRLILARALHRDPRERFPTCTEMIEALEAAFNPADHLATPQADPLTTIEKLVTEAAHPFQAGEHQGIRYLICPDGALEYRCAAWLPRGVAGQKLGGFFNEWNAKVVEEDENFFVFHVAVPQTFWQWLLSPDQYIEVRIQLRPRPQPARLTEVVMRIQCLGFKQEQASQLIQNLGPVVLAAIHTHLLANTEHRSQVRFPFEHTIRVVPAYFSQNTGPPLECRGKDISYTGLGFFAPSPLDASQVYIYQGANAEAPAFTLRANVVRTQPLEDGWYEIGTRFIIERPSSGSGARKRE